MTSWLGSTRAECLNSTKIFKIIILLSGRFCYESFVTTQFPCGQNHPDQLSSLQIMNCVADAQWKASVKRFLVTTYPHSSRVADNTVTWRDAENEGTAIKTRWFRFIEICWVMLCCPVQCNQWDHRLEILKDLYKKKKKKDSQDFLK